MARQAERTATVVLDTRAPPLNYYGRGPTLRARINVGAGRVRFLPIAWPDVPPPGHAGGAGSPDGSARPGTVLIGRDIVRA